MVAVETKVEFRINSQSVLAATSHSRPSATTRGRSRGAPPGRWILEIEATWREAATDAVCRSNRLPVGRWPGHDIGEAPHGVRAPRGMPRGLPELLFAKRLRASRERRSVSVEQGSFLSPLALYERRAPIYRASSHTPPIEGIIPFVIYSLNYPTKSFSRMLHLTDLMVCTYDSFDGKLERK